MPGMLITFEGPDGSGKTTAARFLYNELSDRRIPVVMTREPGGVPLGEKIRDLLLDSEGGMTAQAELLLMWAARMEHYETVIRPQVERGAVVICDRFIDSTMAYQGYGRGLKKECEAMERVFLPKCRIFKTLYFSVDAAEAERRLRLRGGDLNRLDNEDKEFKERVRNGYESRFNFGGERMYRINGNLSMVDVREQVATFMFAHVIPEFDRWSKPSTDTLRRAAKCQPVALR